MIVDCKKSPHAARWFVVLDRDTGEDLTSLRITFADDKAGLIEVLLSLAGHRDRFFIGPDGNIATQVIRRPIRIEVKPGLSDQSRITAEKILETYRDYTSASYPPCRIDDLEGLLIGITEEAADRGRVGMEAVGDVRALLAEFRRMVYERHLVGDLIPGESRNFDGPFRGSSLSGSDFTSAIERASGQSPPDDDLS